MTTFGWMDAEKLCHLDVPEVPINFENNTMASGSLNTRNNG